MSALVAALLALSPTTPRAEAERHVLAAVSAHAATDVDAELLLAIAFVESRYQRDAYAHRRGSHLCGPLQIATRSRATCDALRADVGLSYLTAAQHLRTWARTPVCRARADVELCALQGYSGGWRSVERGAMRYARRVRLVRAMIEREAQRGRVS